MKMIIQFFNLGRGLSRSTYFLIGLSIIGIKHLLDLYLFVETYRNQGINDIPWQLKWYFFTPEVWDNWHYYRFHSDAILNHFYLSIPFFLMGIFLSVKRLRDIGWSPILSLIIIFPNFGLLFFLLLSLLPAQFKLRSKTPLFERIVPSGIFKVAIFSVVLIILVSAILLLISSLFYFLNENFIYISVMPVCFLGILVSIFNSYRQPKDIIECLTSSLMAMFLLIGVFLSFAIEKILVFIWFSPLLLVALFFLATIILGGSFIGYFIKLKSHISKN